MTHDDMADYFARLRAAPAQLPPPVAAVAEAPAHAGPIRSGPASTSKAKRRKGMKQSTLV